MDMLYCLAIRRGLGREQGRDTRVERKEKTRKKNCLLCRPDKDGLVGRSFLGFSGYHKKPPKRRKHFPQGLTPSPDPHLAAFPDSTKLRATFSDRVFISATGNKHKIQRWRDAGPFLDVFVFSDFKVCSHYFHALRGNNFIQQSFVTFFVSFLTDVLIGSCFLPQQFSPARIISASHANVLRGSSRNLSPTGEERLRDEPLRTFAWEACVYIIKLVI